MRLPQSIARYLSVRFFELPILKFAVLIGLAPTILHANTQTIVFLPTNARFGNVIIGQTASQIVTVTNGGSNSVTITAISVSDSQFSVTAPTLPIALAPGQTADITVSFAPATTGWIGAKVVFALGASSTVNLALGGAGVNVQSVVANPTSLSFGSVPMGTSTTAAVVLTNTRSWKVTLTGLQTYGSAFSVSAPSFPLTLGSGQSVTLNVAFTPQLTGPVDGNFFVTGAGLSVPFSGTGTTASPGQLTISPATLNFGDVAVGTTGFQSTVLTASGAAVTISSVSSSSSLFALSGLSLPVTLTVGQSITANVSFTPQNTGTFSGSLSFASNAVNSPTADSLNGTGITHYVNLSWSPPGSGDVVGYNIYRCVPSSCSYTRINSSLEPDTTFTDTTVAPGATYTYAATSVNSSGQESSYSNEINVSVP